MEIAKLLINKGANLNAPFESEKLNGFDPTVTHFINIIIILEIKISCKKV